MKIIQNDKYLKLLKSVAQLSGIFSENSIPYINYRAVENIFCKSFNAVNLSRTDTAYDANYKSTGVGIKTFTLPSSSSTEKIAEFNNLSQELSNHKGLDLALKLAEFRNERIKLANRTYNINDSIYHIVGRKDNELILFQTDYDEIKIDKINKSSIKENKSSIQFDDGINSYRFNYSKSTLYRKFELPKNHLKIDVNILDDPYDLLLKFLNEESQILTKKQYKRGVDYIILPLYGLKKKEKFVHLKSGLNQWNASGRKRDLGEVYIPIPKKIHHLYPNFFPRRDKQFSLEVPTGEIFNAKVCQENSKALMTNPNKDLSDWLLRRVLNLNQGQLASYYHLKKYGFDSVILIKESHNFYKIDKKELDSYENFLEGC